MKWLNGTRIWFALSLVAALAVPPLVLPATSGFDENSKRVDRMTQIERNRLRKNYTDYLSLGEAERAKYAALHDSLAQDAADNGRLARAMEDYMVWKQTLPLYQREELRTTTDAAARIALIEQFIEEQNERRIREFSRGGFPWRRFSGLIIPPAEFAAIMEELQRTVTLGRSERERIASKPEGVERYLEFFQVLGERNVKLVVGGNSVGGAIDAAEAGRILQLFPEEIRNSRQDEDLNRRAGFIGFVIVANIQHQIRMEMRARRPDEAKLKALIAEWPEDRKAELDRLLELPPDEFLKVLNDRYAAQKMALNAEPARTAFSLPPPFGGMRSGSGFPSDGDGDPGSRPGDRGQRERNDPRGNR